MLSFEFVPETSILSANLSFHHKFAIRLNASLALTSVTEVVIEVF